MKKMMPLALGIVLVASLLTACSSNSKSNNSGNMPGMDHSKMDMGGNNQQNNTQTK
ncbi:hypothetical protein JJB07_02815 [Tumebacillus sp. ITR2]|uniref:Lipoprotein n=1 Tax=Tumebacillus amylolyticus TaxID=2801339 RepID=A0ABS1J5N8_9BACL|nr:hypothetical protein [Tumebacillus amylolyticus]MBL0385571.1 hypothetical protein [Tumebacillus amylolyticus]